MQARFSWIAAGVAALVVAVLILVAVGNWQRIGGAEISFNGWIAMFLGVVATLAVGVGLMVLIFISNRHGYDDPL